MLAISCGGCINKMLSLTIGEVWQHRRPKQAQKGCDQISVSRLNTTPILYNSLAEIEADMMTLELGNVSITSMICWRDYL